MTEAFPVLVVLAGKGGVGKTSITTLLALELAKSGLQVGLIDGDLCHPNIPQILGLGAETIKQGEAGWEPVEKRVGKGNLQVVSLGFLVTKGAIILKGPKKKLLLRKFLTGVLWKNLAYLLIDTPPGTGDEHLCLLEELETRKTCGIVVTTSQSVSVADNRRMINLCRRHDLFLLGLLENMSGYLCDHCGTGTNIFSKKGGEHLAEECGLPFLGFVALSPIIGELPLRSLKPGVEHSLEGIDLKRVIEELKKWRTNFSSEKAP